MSDILFRLEGLIAERRAELAADPTLATRSYMAKQVARGRLKLAEKLGEEATETLIAGIAQDDQALAAEAADLLFHLLLLLGDRGVPFSAVLTELEQREGVSGITEKESRA